MWSFYPFFGKSSSSIFSEGNGLCSYRFGMSVGGGKFRIFLGHQLAEVSTFCVLLFLGYIRSEEVFQQYCTVIVNINNFIIFYLVEVHSLLKYRTFRLLLFSYYKWHYDKHRPAYIFFPSFGLDYPSGMNTQEWNYWVRRYAPFYYSWYILSNCFPVGSFQFTLPWIVCEIKILL